MANYVYVGSSLDGYIAGKNDNLDWLERNSPPEGDDLGFEEFNSKIDAIVMGRKSYEFVCSFGQWPYTKPVFVLGQNIKDTKLATPISGSPREIVNSLKEKGFNNLYIDGGLTIQSFLKEDLIDEIIVTILPVLLGGGVKLFGELPYELWFETYKTELLSIKSAKIYLKRSRHC